MNIRVWKVFCGIALIAFATAVSGQGSSTAQKIQTARKPPAASSPYDKALLTPSALVARAPAEFDVKFNTTVGDFVVHVTRAWGPHGADRFYNLVKHHYYDGAGFYRVLDFMAQFGFSAYPAVNMAWTSATIKDDPITHSNTRGMVTYASPGSANSRTTQLFISYKDNSYLDKMVGFEPFGEVTSGMDVVDKIYHGYGEQPDQDKVGMRGKEYLEKEFPKTTFVKTTTLIVPPAAGAVSKPAPKP